MAAATYLSVTNLRPRQGPRGGQWEKVGNWTQGKKRGRVSGVLSVPLPLLAQDALPLLPLCIL
eukprot:1196165-Prorocentrum_minimum.AAC.3